MTVGQHVQTALAFLDHSDREFVDGDALEGSEKLWGAFARYNRHSQATRLAFR